MVEFLADRDLEDNAKTNWDVLPQMQVTISKRQHVRLDFGVRVPVNNTLDVQCNSCSTCSGTGKTES